MAVALALAIDSVAVMTFDLTRAGLVCKRCWMHNKVGLHVQRVFLYRVRKVKIRPLNFGQITTGASRAHRYLINRTPIPVLSASFGGELHDLPPIRD